MKSFNKFKLINFKKVLSFDNSNEIFIIDGKVSRESKLDDCEVLDLKDCILSPGFIDPQVNGLNNCSFWDLEENNLDEIDKLRVNLAYQGVTGFCPTVITNSKDKILKSVDLINSYIKNSKDKPGAKILGIHIEGIFISKYGVHEKQHAINELTVNNIKSFIKENVILFTLAPELDKTGEAIKFLKESNITVSIGHTNATYEEGLKALDEYGVNLCTHMFNAMKGVNGFNHRGIDENNLKALKEKLDDKNKINPKDDGIMLALLKNKNVVSMAIPDGLHVSKEAIKFLYEIKGKDKFAITTDMVSNPFFKESEKVGTLGGGQTGFDKCVTNLTTWNVSNLEDILISASTTTSKALNNGRNNGFGEIQYEKDAYITIWDTCKNKVKGTIIGKNLFLNF
jgi:N-acetylglucosamine-6-phosphate deacetylase